MSCWAQRSIYRRFLRTNPSVFNRKLSIVILNYNVRYFLELALKSAQAAIAEIDAEIIVVDNDSSDDSCAMVKRVFPEVKLIENKENLGF